MYCYNIYRTCYQLDNRYYYYTQPSYPPNRYYTPNRYYRPNMTNSSVVETRFTGLRRHLDQLGYKQPLGLDGIPLAERLLSDLLQTTDSLRLAELDLQKHQNEKTVFTQHVEPYRSDNAKFVCENNELHAQLLKAKETNENRMRDLKFTLRGMEHENTDLKFLNTQYLDKIRFQEKDITNRSNKINVLQEKNQSAIIQTPNGSRRNIPYRRQRMELDNHLPDNIPVVRDPGSINSPEPEQIDLMAIADERINSLNHKVIILPHLLVFHRVYIV